jgi:hypothetical protein
MAATTLPGRHRSLRAGHRSSQVSFSSLSSSTPSLVPAQPSIFYPVGRGISHYGWNSGSPVCQRTKAASSANCSWRWVRLEPKPCPPSKSTRRSTGFPLPDAAWRRAMNFARIQDGLADRYAGHTHHRRALRLVRHVVIRADRPAIKVIAAGDQRRIRKGGLP